MIFDYIEELEMIHDKIIIDDYLPIKIILKESVATEEKYYYQYIDRFDSIIEIAVDKESLQIFDLNFVGINKIEKKNVENSDNVNIIGMPVLNHEIFNNENYVTDDSGFEIYGTDKREVYVKFNNDEIFDEVIVSQHLSFSFNKENELVSLKIQGFSKKEWKKLTNIINWTVKNEGNNN